MGLGLKRFVSIASGSKARCYLSHNKFVMYCNCLAYLQWKFLRNILLSCKIPQYDGVLYYLSKEKSLILNFERCVCLCVCVCEGAHRCRLILYSLELPWGVGVITFSVLERNQDREVKEGMLAHKNPFQVYNLLVRKFLANTSKTLSHISLVFTTPLLKGKRSFYLHSSFII